MMSLLIAEWQEGGSKSVQVQQVAGSIDIKRLIIFEESDGAYIRSDETVSIKKNRLPNVPEWPLCYSETHQICAGAMQQPLVSNGNVMVNQ